MKCLVSGLAGAVLLMLSLGGPATGTTVGLNVVDDPEEGFNDPVWGATRLAPFVRAAETWSRHLQPGFPGESITVDIETIALDPDVAAMARPTNFVRALNSAGRLAEGHWYPAALGNHLIGTDLGGTAESEAILGVADRMNDQTPSTRPDLFDGKDFTAEHFDYLVDLGLHEIGHGLGMLSHFTSSARLATRFPAQGSAPAVLLDAELPSVFDRFVSDANGRPLAGMTPSERAAAAGGPLFFTGLAAREANGGVPPALLAAFGAGGLSHFDPAIHPTAIMRGGSLLPGAGAGDLDSLDLAAFRDLGWSIDQPAAAPVPAPAALPLLAGALGILAFAARRRILPDARAALPRSPARDALPIAVSG